MKSGPRNMLLRLAAAGGVLMDPPEGSYHRNWVRPLRTRGFVEDTNLYDDSVLLVLTDAGWDAAIAAGASAELRPEPKK